MFLLHFTKIIFVYFCNNMKVVFLIDFSNGFSHSQTWHSVFKTDIYSTIKTLKAIRLSSFLSSRKCRLQFGQQYA